jgi:hypothetical protein
MAMMLLEAIGQKKGTRRRPRPAPRLPETRPSILDPMLESEPWIDCCCFGDTLALFLHNHPIALIAGSSLDCSSLSTRLSQLRHRNPRQK